MKIRELPAEVIQLLTNLNAPSRLVAHLTLVHDVAFEILEAFQKHWPNLVIDREAVLFGPSTHDIGKVLHPHELCGPGNRHEEDGPALLEKCGFSPDRSRFARTHGSWDHEPNLDLEDFVVALSDHAWKGSRNDKLESKVASIIATTLGLETWKVFLTLDNILVEIASRAEE